MIRRAFERHLGAERRLRGDIRIPDGPPPRSAVVVVHGFRGFKEWGFLPWLRDRLVADGHAAVGFDFTGSGIGSDPLRITDTAAFRDNTFSKELEELGIVVEEVRSGALLPRPPRRVGVVGHGRGGAIAVLHAAGAAPPDALVTWGALARLDRWRAETLEAWRRDGVVHVPDPLTGGHLPIGRGLLDDFEANRDRLDPAGAAADVHAPWLLVHGTEDVRVPLREARELARRGPRVRMHVVEGGDHTFGVGHPWKEASAELEEAARVTLGHLRRHLLEGR